MSTIQKQTFEELNQHYLMAEVARMRELLEKPVITPMIISTETKKIFRPLLRFAGKWNFLQPLKRFVPRSS
jgi:hypothetical protein